MPGCERLSWGAAWILFAALGCGITRDTVGSKAGDPSVDASAPTSMAGSAGANNGVGAGDANVAIAAGGEPVIAAGGSAAGGRAAATGGTSFAGGAARGFSVNCLGSDGRIVPSLKFCNVDGDCTTIALRSCCGNLIAGIASNQICNPPVPIDCPESCPGPVHDTTDDGKNTDQGALETRCTREGDGGSGQCRTVVVSTAGATLCGEFACSAGSVCVHPPTSLGGPAPDCVDPLDGGACPAGTSMQPFCGGRAGGGCVRDYVPPPPQCIPMPPGCTAGLSCTCLPSSVCGGGANVCQRTAGSDVFCLNEAA